MGCGPSHLPQEGGSTNTPRDKPIDNENKGLANGHPVAVKENNAKNKQSQKTTDTNANREDVITNNQPAFPKSISFAVGMDGDTKESLIAKHPPIKLKRLEPLNMPILTPELLKEKQRLADEKRDKELQRKVSASRKSSKRRRELMAAKDFELQQMQEQEQTKMQSAETLRLAKLNEIKEKQKMREERARRAREKAQRMKQAEQADLGILEVEKDDQYNADDVDSWLDGDNNNSREDRSAMGDRVYSGGRCSPQKHLQDTTNQRYHSASTVDSFDNAYNRKPPSASAPRQSQLQEETDDFFDS
ncbi:ensconsin-like [Argopecten irradians]|uniref:ensconsin-like n=1 Tax=Argopecten irradians TaxID=31199 RepID=UPI00371618D6